MSNSLYREAINAAEEIKFAAEEKAKQQIIESISPQIKLMVEEKIFEDKLKDKEKSDDDEQNTDDEESDRENLQKSDCGTEKKVELSQESKMILNKIISTNAKKNSAFSKIENIKEGIHSLQKAIILSENTDNFGKTQKRIHTLYKNLLSEVVKLKNNSIIKSDKDLLQEFYKLNKELHNMSRRRSNNKYLSESLEDLLEMDLFEAEGEEQESDSEDTSDDDLDLDLDSPIEDSGSDEKTFSADDLGDMTVDQLADLVKGESSDDMDMPSDDAPEDDEDKDSDDDPDLDLAWLSEDPEEGDLDDDSLDTAGVNESSRRDRVLEIDENMLRREIGKMKSIREGEAKDMASHFGGGSVQGEMFVDGVELNKLHEIKIKAAKVVRKNRMLESKLSQYKKALRGMKGQLTEMNLFNAKLLYANKLMQNRDLSIKQQRHVVESLDEAKTLGEAKILFESLSKSLVSSRPASRGKNLSEGSIKRPMNSSSSPVRSAQKLNESVALDRWATLAGIKK